MCFTDTTLLSAASMCMDEIEKISAEEFEVQTEIPAPRRKK